MANRKSPTKTRNRKHTPLWRNWKGGLMRWSGACQSLRPSFLDLLYRNG